LLSLADAGSVADIIEQIEDQDSTELAESLSPEMLVQVLAEMAPDEAANLLGDIDAKLLRKQILRNCRKLIACGGCCATRTIPPAA
jgi:flagellar motility protein MotE (MotC chaperone)